MTAFRLEGVAPSVAHRQAVLEELARPYRPPGHASRRLLADILASGSATSTPFAAAGPAGARDVWRISTAPARGVEIGRALVERAEAEVLYDWAGGLIWAALPSSDDAGVRSRAFDRRRGGRACDADPRTGRGARQRSMFLSPRRRRLAALTKRVRESFDPRGVLNPGRMWAGV